MRKFLVLFVLMIVGAKMGVDYLFSEKFQAYGDRTKATWTCEVNLVVGQYCNMMSRYPQARYFFEKIIERCPETPVGIEAEFEIARALENQGLRTDAIGAYERYAEKYPGTRRGRLASKSAGILKT